MMLAMTPDEEPPGHLPSDAVRLVVVTPEDWQAWRELRLRALAEAPYAFSSTLADWEAAPEARWRDRLAVADSRSFLALAGGRAVGMASGIPGDEQGTVELVSMYVAPEGRSLGVADALVHDVEAWALEVGAARLCLGVRATNDRARRVYERHGLVVTGERERDTPDEPLELEMSKELGR